MEPRSGRSFSEPAGCDVARVHLVSALAFVGMYAYAGLPPGSGPVFTLAIEVTAGLVCVAKRIPRVESE